MKKLLFLILLPLLLCSQVKHNAELEIEVINISKFWDVTLLATVIGDAWWDEDYNLTSDYNSASVHLHYWADPIVTKARFDYVIDPLAGINPILAVGLYKISALKNGYEQAYFYLDLRTSDYGVCPDIYFKYNYGDDNFRDADNTQTIDGTTQNVWDLVSGIDHVTTDLEPFAPNNLSTSNYNGRARISWQRQSNDDYVTSYDIYRSLLNRLFGYTKIGSTTNQFYIDYDILVGSGNTAYYKVKAINGTKVSDFSDYASIDYYGLNKPVVNDSSIVQLVSYEYSLGANYPNPFNPSTTINYSIANPTNVKLQVYNLHGDEVATLVNDYKNPGNYSFEFKAFEYLPSGIYIYKVTTKDFSEYKKMMLLK